MYFDFLYEIRIFRPNVAKFGNVNYAFHKLRGKTGASKRIFIWSEYWGFVDREFFELSYHGNIEVRNQYLKTKSENNKK